MKKFSLFFVYLFTLFSIIFVPTLAKYQSKEFGDLFHADFNKETVFEGVYIKNLEVVETKNASIVSSSYILPTNVSTIVNTSTTNSSITYKVTVHNNTDSTYWYFDQHFNKEFESNNLLGVDNGITVTTKDKLSDTTETFNNEDWVPPQTERDFYVTYTFGANARGYTTTLIAFHFDIKMDSLYDGFLAVLNDKITETGYNYLAEEFDKRYKEDGTTVIGNIGADKEVFNDIFGGELTLTVDGVEKPVTVLVRRENVDGTANGDSYANGGPSGCEYTLYITTDDLSDPNGKATVYVISYSCDSNGKWHQLGQLYQGTSNKEDYGLVEDKYEGSLDISTWIASANTYEISDGIVYKVGQEQGDQYDKMNTVEDLMSVYDQDIFNDIDNSKILMKAYTILKNNKGSTNPAIVQLQVAFDNMEPYYVNHNNGQELKVKRDATRARLLPFLLDLQEALDYYDQTVAAAANKN